MATVASSALSLRQIYTDSCLQLQCRPNKEVLAQLPEYVKDTLGFCSLSLGERNLVGPIGCKAIVVVAQCSPNLELLDFSSNQLQNETIEFMCPLLADHPTLHTIILDDNPISYPAAKSLLKNFARDNNNTKVARISVEGTLINKALALRITREVAAKRKTGVVLC